MRGALQWLRRLGTACGAAVLMALIGFVLVQTAAGRAWLERTIAAAASTSDRRLAIEGLAGLVPFRFSVKQIALADHIGNWVTLRDVGIEVRTAALLAGRVEIGALTIGEANLARLPAAGQSARPVTDYVRLPRLPFAVALDRVSIARVALANPVLGEPVAARLAGHAAISNGNAHAALDLSRIDGHAGDLVLALALAGAPPRLTLHLAASEPSGLLLDRLLGRHDRLPLTMTLAGAGPVADWRGKLAVSAGPRARTEARMMLVVAGKTALRLSGTAASAALFPTPIASLLGDRVGFSLDLTKTADRLLVDRLSVNLPAGELTGTGALARSSVAAELRADVPNLAPLAGAIGISAKGAVNLAMKLHGSCAAPATAAHLTATLHGERQGAAGWRGCVESRCGAVAVGRTYL
jgi:translocation and assembly module TamB